MNFIKKVPVPLAGVMLGFAALGNLLQSYGEGIRTCCGVVSALLLVLLLLKLICYPKMVAEDLKNPIMAGVSGTFPMGLMLLSTYVKPVIGGAAQIIWFLAIALHVVLIIYFTLTFVLKFDLKKVFTVWYIAYVGIVVASVTAPAYEQTGLGTILFWFGFICLLVLLVVVTMRYAKLPVPDPAKPLICIYAAPIALCTAGYIQSVTPKNFTFVVAMCVCANLVYIFALVQGLRLCTGKFFPSFAAFTFPFVITAIATKQTMACAAKMEHPLPFLKPIVLVETIIAVLFCVYALVRFLMFIFGTEKKAA